MCLSEDKLPPTLYLAVIPGFLCSSLGVSVCCHFLLLSSTLRWRFLFCCFSIPSPGAFLPKLQPNIWHSLKDFLELDFLPASLGFWGPRSWLLLYPLPQQGPHCQQVYLNAGESVMFQEERVFRLSTALVASLQGCCREWIGRLFKTPNIKC